jgi:sulfur carrier protein
MQIELNGEKHDAADGTTIRELLKGEEVDPEAKGLAVAVNAEVVPRSEWGGTLLKPGDVVEVIRAVQGG